LYCRGEATFIQKHHDLAYPVLSLIEDALGQPGTGTPGTVSLILGLKQLSWPLRRPRLACLQ
jgi:hypothetical protein